MLATIKSGAIIGLEAIEVIVEVDYNSRGMTSFTIVGLPDTAVQESRERVRSLAFVIWRCQFNAAAGFDVDIAVGSTG